MRYKNILIFLALLVLAISLRSINLERGFFGDEAVTLASASADFRDIIPNLVKYDAHPPLTSILLHAWMRISQNEIFTRYYFVLFGVGVLWIIYLISLEYFNRNRNIALLVLLFGAISPLLVATSQFIRNYMDSAFWIILSNYFLLLIIKDKASKWTWRGYLLSAVFSLYTFYFSAFIIISQCIYVFIFRFKRRALLKKWVLHQLAVGLLFLPWLPHLLGQFSNKDSSRVLDWSGFGFRLAGLNLGIYARNISALFGMDHFFMVYPDGVRSHFSLFALLVMVLAALFSLVVFIYFILRWLKEYFPDRQELVWFLPFLSLLPVILTWMSSGFTKILLNVRYIAGPHAMFIILICFFLWRLILRNKRIGIAFLCVAAVCYATRLPAAVRPLYDGKKVLVYLQEQIKSGDCIVMVDRLPGREELEIPSFNIEAYLGIRDSETFRYLSIGNDLGKLSDILRQFRRVWFIRCYGNSEIFGLNQLAYDALLACGREESAAKEFSNIKLILME